jgi:CRP-like cAMP-binding protein
MSREEILERLAADSTFGTLPHAELEWIAEHGTLHRYEVGEVVGRKGERIDAMYVLLTGRLSIHVGERSGWRRMFEWRAGELSGRLPFSRMSSSPGDSVVEEPIEAVMIHEDLFPEMARECPQLTASAVHSMLDRARTFNTAYLQDEKLLSLGRVAAGLAHELNTPASAAVRGAKLLASGLQEAEDAARDLRALGLDEARLAHVERLRESCL